MQVGWSVAGAVATAINSSTQETPAFAGVTIKEGSASDTTQRLNLAVTPAQAGVSCVQAKKNPTPPTNAAAYDAPPQSWTAQ